MEIQDLIPIEWSKQRVLTSEQVAQGLNCSLDAIKANFKNHKEQFVEGVHYYKLTGEALRSFRRLVNDVYPPTSPHHISKYASNLYLWTHQGVVRHSKLIDTAEAWAMFDVLERFYFGVIRGEVPAPEVPTTPAPNDSEEADTLAIRIKKQFDCPTDLAVVYALLMSNLTVKIGITKDLPDRIKQLKAETKLDVFNFASTRYMPREEALALEAALKEKYAADCLGGEFFDVRFLDVAAQL